MVISPEHPLINLITTSDREVLVSDYCKAAALKSEIDRTDLSKNKTGVFTGRYALNPVNGMKIPIWVADYVLTGYGTGAIMAVPAHDTRDFEFAKKFNLPVICILDPKGADAEVREQVLNGFACWVEDGSYINSSSEVNGLNINGFQKEQGIKSMIGWLEETGNGTSKVNYKMRDWLFSRQRYWGEPFPVIHWEDGEITVLNDRDLPIRLPQLEKYQPGTNGESPLANSEEWLHVTDKNGRKGRRETNTMPQWAGSCWYFLRFTDPNNNSEPFSQISEMYWMPVDLYIGGAEHAVLHLLYSRFWHKVLFDLGIVSTDEPFKKLFNQGMVLAFAYETFTGYKIPSDQVEERDGKFYHKESGEELRQIVAKMSKSLKNVITPDDVVSKYGADSLRLYEMFMGPLEAVKPWTETGIKGVFRFLSGVFRFFGDPQHYFEGEEDIDVLKLLHKTIEKVSGDIEKLSFNTAIPQMMIFTNLCMKKQKVTRATGANFAKVLSPFAPHIAEELWEILGNKHTLAYEKFPEVEQKYLLEDSVNYPVSINGKKRFELILPKDMQVDDIERIAVTHTEARKWLQGTMPKKIIVVPGKIINIVI